MSEFNHTKVSNNEGLGIMDPLQNKEDTVEEEQKVIQLLNNLVLVQDQHYNQKFTYQNQELGAVGQTFEEMQTIIETSPMIAEHGQRITQIFAEHSQRMYQMFAEHSQRVDQIFAEHSQRMDRMDWMFAEHGQRSRISNF
jgi:DNA anti-recombination protein RmuC